MYNQYGSQLWGQYGLKDAFNITQNWFDTDYIGIDEGPIIIMIENYRTQTVWNRMMQNSTIATGLARAGFTTVTGVDHSIENKIHDFKLDQNYPNPFNPTTEISFSISGNDRVSLNVYDMLGRIVSIIVDRKFGPGTYKFSWDGSGMPSGIYFSQLKAGSHVETRKMVLMR
jgi:hypothetical protein